MRVGFHRTFTALSLYFGVRLFVEKCPEILAMSMNIHIAKKKSRPPYGGRLFSVNIPKIWILWGLFPFSRFLPHFQCNSAFNFCPKNVPKFTIRCAHFPQRVHGNLRGFDILVVIIDMHGHLSLHLMDRVVWNVLSGGPQIKSKSMEKQ